MSASKQIIMDPDHIKPIRLAANMKESLNYYFLDDFIYSLREGLRENYINSRVNIS